VDNLYTDHLSRHGTLERYFDISAFAASVPAEVLNGDDAYLSQVSVNQWKLDACWTSVKADLIGNPALGTYIEDGWVVAQGEPIVDVALRMPGSAKSTDGSSGSSWD